MINGTNILILVNTGTPSVPTYEALGSQRGATIDETTEIIDYSSKESRNRRVGPGRYSSTMSLDALYVPGSTQYQALKDAMRNGTTLLVAKEESGDVMETVDAVVASLSEDYPDQGEATVSASFEIDDIWVVVGS